MLTSIKVRGFRTLKDVTIPLKPITVFVGPNNSGKTNTVRAIQILLRMAGIRAPKIGDSRVWPDESNEDSPFSIEAIGVFEQTQLRVEMTSPSRMEHFGTAALTYSGDVGWSASFRSGSMRSQGPDGRDFHSQNIPDFFDEALRRGAPLSPGAGRAAQFFRGHRVASLSVPKLREPAAIAREPELGERGENFGAVLDWATSKPALQRRINQELRRVLGIDGFTTKVTHDGMKIAALSEGDESYGADVVSDGVLLYMGLTTAAQMAQSGSILIVEEPENGIHPRRLQALLEQIRRIAELGTQIVLTTHSPVLLDQFSEEPDCLVVFDRDARGTHVSQPDSDQLKQVLSGEFGLGSLWFSGAIGGVPK